MSSPGSVSSSTAIAASRIVCRRAWLCLSHLSCRPSGRSRSVDDISTSLLPQPASRTVTGTHDVLPRHPAQLGGVHELEPRPAALHAPASLLVVDRPPSRGIDRN